MKINDKYVNCVDILRKMDPKSGPGREFRRIALEISKTDKFRISLNPDQRRVRDFIAENSVFLNCKTRDRTVGSLNILEIILMLDLMEKGLTLRWIKKYQLHISQGENSGEPLKWWMYLSFPEFYQKWFGVKKALRIFESSAGSP